MLEEAVGIFAVSTVGGPTRRLHVGHTIRLGPEHAEEGFGMHRPCPNLHVVGLLDDTSSVAPIFLQLKDEVLKCGALQDFRLYFRFQRFHPLPFQMLSWRLIPSRCDAPEYLMHNLRFLLRERLEDFLSTNAPMFHLELNVQLKVLL